ncbi:Uncharacterized protein TCM_019755 [Theobroma cacao]|uniref:Reverse transcriptase domain-containing protein n=1 Tax=Theobroma cacao TaxID=3641 RepID=A0A061EJC1_THECC|nr:Uncharacterized protein TCM_019755 [Theobroma cacao]
MATNNMLETRQCGWSLWEDCSSSFNSSIFGEPTEDRDDIHVRNADERTGCSKLGSSIGDFNDFINDCELSNLPLEGKKFTWFGTSAKCNRLDRFLSSAEWFLRFRKLRVITLIPKVPNPTSLKEYRVISLIFSLYKNLAKLLINKLKKVIHIVIVKIKVYLFMAGRSVMVFVAMCSILVLGLNGGSRFMYTSPQSRAEQMQYFHGITLMRLNLTISHLQFVDDIVIFLEPSTNNALNIKRFLRSFELLSSININYGKSYVYPVGVENSVASNMVNIMCYNVGTLPFTYLGRPLKANPRNLATWEPIIAKFISRLAI